MSKPTSNPQNLLNKVDCIKGSVPKILELLEIRPEQPTVRNKTGLKMERDRKLLACGKCLQWN